MNRLIAFVGFKASGKNTAAQILVDHYDFVPLSFADAIKDCLAAIFCWPRELLEGVTPASRLWRETVDSWWAVRLEIADFTPRWAMMHFGTEIMRRHFNSQIWVANVERRIELVGDRPVVLLDGRFPNELALVRRRRGRVARIQRGADPDWMTTTDAATARHRARGAGVHESEYAWIGSTVDATLINDGSIAALQAGVLDWLGLTQPAFV